MTISSNSLSRSLKKIALCSSVVMGLSACGGDDKSDDNAKTVDQSPVIKAQS